MPEKADINSVKSFRAITNRFGTSVYYPSSKEFVKRLRHRRTKFDEMTGILGEVLAEAGEQVTKGAR